MDTNMTLDELKSMTIPRLEELHEEAATFWNDNIKKKPEECRPYGRLIRNIKRAILARLKAGDEATQEQSVSLCLKEGKLVVGSDESDDKIIDYFATKNAINFAPKLHSAGDEIIHVKLGNKGIGTLIFRSGAKWWFYIDRDDKDNGSTPQP